MLLKRKLKYSAIAVVTLLLNPIGYVLADYKSDYQTAVRNIQQQKWQQAINSLNKIKEFNQQELASMPVSGGKSIPYLPKYYKGLALFHLGKCGEAERNWVSSLAQRVVKSFEDKHRDLQKMREVCRSRLVDGKYIDKLAPSKQKATVAVNKFKRQYNALNTLYKKSNVSQLSKNNRFVSSQLASFRKQFNAAKSSTKNFSMMPYSSANQKIIINKTKQFNTQTQQCKLYIDQLKGYSDAISKLRTNLNAIDTNTKLLVELQSEPSLQEDWKSNGKLGRHFGQLRQQRKFYNDQSKSVFEVSNLSSMKENTQKANDIFKQSVKFEKEVSSLVNYANQKIARIDQRLQQEKKQVYAGVDAFFSGDYKNAAVMLLAADINEPRGQYYKNLFIAAAYFYDPIISEEVAQEKARPYIVKAKKTNIQEDFNQKAFSPKFIAFYKAVN